MILVNPSDISVKVICKRTFLWNLEFLSEEKINNVINNGISFLFRNLKGRTILRVWALSFELKGPFTQREILPGTVNVMDC